MPFTQTTFFGSSVRSVNSQLGWNLGQQSSVTISLVDDASNGDSFAPPSVGTAVYFDFDSFKFYGILQKIESKKDTNGYPLHEVVIVDPRELLENVQVITGGYAASITGIYNLVSPYGYYENTGFGNAGSNNSGMLWSQVAAGLIAILNQPSYTAWGGPITFNATKYSIDLSEIPSMPTNYRVGGSQSIGLLELIAQVCEDAACDFFIELVGYTITVKTVSRYAQPPLGTITSITNSNFGGTLIRSHNGLEVRNETTSSFLVGGKVSTLYQTSDMASFWGFDINGSPILGTTRRLDFTDSRYTGAVAVANFPIGSTVLNLTIAGAAWPAHLPSYVKIGNEIIRLDTLVGPNQYNVTRGMFTSTEANHVIGDTITYNWSSIITEEMNLNASKISEILGSNSYNCTEFEMRLALIDFNSWATYINHHRSDIAALINLTAAFLNNVNANQLFLAPDLVADNRNVAQALAASMVTGTAYANQQKVFEFVRGYAQNYMGKKYAAAVPLVVYAQDPDTLKITTSYEVSDGGYLPESSTPLGLSTANQDVFKNQDGTFRSFIMYSGLYVSPGANLSNISPADSVIEASSTLFAGCTVDPNFIYIPDPAVVVTANDGVFDNAVDTVGSIDMAANVLMTTPANARILQQNRAAGSNIVRVFPAPRFPGAVAIPLRSNIATYGPWYAQGAAGKVRFEQDPSLVPWEYGGDYSVMNLVGVARVNQAVTNMQVSEAGAIEIVGAPAYSLGETLQAGGPNVTNIQISYGPQGVTTTYSFHTFSLKTGLFGVFGKHGTERLKKASQTATELRRASRLSLKEAEKISTSVARAANAARVRALNEAAPPAMNPATPHEGFVAKNTYDSTLNAVRTNLSTATYQEIVPFVGADDDADYMATAAMSLAGVLRPFSTKQSQSSFIPAFDTPTTTGEAIGQSQLNPFRQQNDVEFFTWGPTYSGLHAQRRQPNLAEGMRGIGLRAPLVLAGWGYDWEGKPCPNYGEVLNDGSGFPIAASSLASVDGGFPTGYLVRSDWWAAGPLDTLYDRKRGVWTCHDVVKGISHYPLPANTGVGTIRLQQGIGNSLVDIGSLEVYNYGDDPIQSGDRVTALYHVNDNKWFVHKNALTSSSGILGSGNPYELYYTNSLGVALWSKSPILGSGLWVGGNGVSASPGKIGLGHPSNGNYLELETPAQSSTTVFKFPNNTPSGDLRVKSHVGSIIETEWYVPETGYTKTFNVVTSITAIGSNISYGTRSVSVFRGLVTNVGPITTSFFAVPCPCGDGSGNGNGSYTAATGEAMILFSGTSDTTYNAGYMLFSGETSGY